MHVKNLNITFGANCEVAYALGKHGIPLESSLLNWAFIRSEESLFKALESPQGCFSKGGLLINKNMFECSNLGVAFHGKVNFDDWDNRDQNSCNQVRESMTELISRTSYLSSKLVDQLSGQAVNIFLKPPIQLDSPNNREFSIVLRRLIDNNYINNNVRIFVVGIGGNFSLEAVHEPGKLFIATISEYTDGRPADDFTEQALGEWKKIFDFACHS